MEIRVWQSYSCNNSSSFRLVARFSDPKKAGEAAVELKQFFKEHAKQADKAMDEAFGDGGDENAWPPPATKACEALAAKYGFKWKEWLGWGDDSLVGDEPEVVASDGTLVIYHGYCGEFPKEVTTYLKARGATKIDEDEDAPEVSVLFKIPSNGKKLEDSLTKLFAQAANTEYLNDWTKQPPWSGGDQPDDESKNVAFFSDKKTIGFYLPIQPNQLEKLKKYLAKNGVDNPSIRLCEFSDRKKFQAIAGAQCEACGELLSYIDPRTHKIDSEQLACDKCGGMFDLAAIAKKKKPKPKPKKPEPVVVEAAAPKKKATKKMATKKKAASKKPKTTAKKKTKKKAASKKKK
jgi:hypothetical protein